ncbi:MAG: CAP domain-containing protein [Actinobacteria bacterium]|nr:CAP domain-containing protein [Actinomycetota bacterium]
MAVEALPVWRRAPLLVVVAVVMAVLLAGWAARAGTHSTSSAAAEAAFTDLIAKERAAAGVAPYRRAGDLAEVARSHAERMAGEGRLYHNPDLREQVQNWDVVGENVGKGDTVEAIHDAFMGSDSHRREILSTRVTEVGVGVAQRDGLIWVSQVFRRSTPAPATAPSEPAPAPAGAEGSRRTPPRRPAPSAPAPTPPPLPPTIPPSAPSAAPAPAPAPAAVRTRPMVGSPRQREVSTEVAVATGLLLMAVSGLTSQVGSGSAAPRRRLG